MPGDLRDRAYCLRLVDTAVKQLGGLDILVNNASRQQQKQSLLDITDEDFDATMKTNLYGMFYVTKAALPHLKPGSAIIQTTSEQAYDPSKDLVDYAMTKAAMMNFTKSLAKQTRAEGYPGQWRGPGPIWTPLQVSGGATMEKLQQFGGNTPLGRPGQPAELGSIYVQASPRRTRAMPTARSTAPRAVAASRDVHACELPGSHADLQSRHDCDVTDPPPRRRLA
ncbi:SDR family oxidoreductase [Sphingomonas aurantiaca]|uniref:SDR family oxidoreductase n=1 Tax=Sphingomonas aurantiaca TaxID=185949 RepID=UPI003A5C75E9